MPFFGREVKPFVPCHTFAAQKRTLFDYVEVGSQAKSVGHFSLEVPSFSKQRTPRSSSMGAPGVDGGNQKARCTKGQYNIGLGAYGVTLPLTNLSMQRNFSLWIQICNQHFSITMTFFIIDFSEFWVFSSVIFLYVNQSFKLFWTQGGHKQFTIIKSLAVCA
jgi:hypothetical protein